MRIKWKQYCHPKTHKKGSNPMKTIPLYVKGLVSMIIIPGVMLVFNLTSAQISDRTEGQDVHKVMKETTGTEKKPVTTQVAVDNVTPTIGLVTPALSLKEKSIEVTLVRGQITKHTLMIHNLREYPLAWEISLKGETRVLYRLYDRSQECLLSEDSGDEDETIGEASSDFMTESLSSEISKPRLPTPDRLSEALTPIKQTRSAASPADSVDVESSHIFTEMLAEPMISYTGGSERADLKNPMQIFARWYRFADCGYPSFEPKVDVMEVSDDNGNHWQQVLTIGNRPYVINAKCFNPLEFLEEHSLNSENLSLAGITALDDFLADAQQRSSGFIIQPRSGTIPPKDSVQVTLTFDSGTWVNGDHDSYFVLRNNGYIQNEIVVPVKFTAISAPMEGENDTPLIAESGNTGENQIPNEFALLQNYPNPFNPLTTIKFLLPSRKFVTLKVFDALGREVATLLNEDKNAGVFAIEWNAIELSSGFYFYRLQAGDFVETKKMLLMK